MDIDFATYHWDSPGNTIPDESPLIDDLFFGQLSKDNTAWTDEKYEQEIRPERTRKVTITEITEENYDDVMSDESDEEAVMETEEVFQILDDVVQDWKIKLECVVGDGLKKLRKAGKEKKLMIKYLPGEHTSDGKKIGVPKATIMKDWKIDFTHIVTGIQKKLDKLTKDKVNEVDSLYNDKFLYTNTNVKEVEELNRNKKDVIKIDSRDNKPKERGSTYTGLKQLIRELNKMCDKVASSNYMMNENVVPIYNMHNDNQRPNIVANTYETPLNQYLKHLMTLPPPNSPPNFQTSYDPDVIAKNQANILDALEDFRLQQGTQNKFLKMKMKENRRDSSKLSAQRKMLQRKVNRKGVSIRARHEKKPEIKYSFRMKHYNKNGKEHYLIVKKAESTEKVEVEDIFEDWRANTLDDINDRKRQRTPRVRKLSHKAQRKEMLREDSTPAEGPLLYAEVLKKNLKFRPNNGPVEDIFEAWKDYLQELDDLLSGSLPSTTESSRHASGECDKEIQIQNAQQEQILDSSANILETAMVDQKELQSCGQPTMRTVPFDTSNDRVKHPDLLKSFTIPVQVCGMPSKYDIGNPTQAGRIKKVDARKKQRIMKVQPEIYFAGWRYNFQRDSDLNGSPKQNRKTRYETEEYFRGWRRNLYVKERTELDEEIAEKRKRRQTQPKMMPEKIFNEWLHNFHWHRRPSKYGSLKRRSSIRTEGSVQEHHEHETEEVVTNDKSLKNKSRSTRQRRSKNKK